MTRRFSERMERILRDLLKEMPLENSHLLVVGVSTSEVLGERIGQAGSGDVARALFAPIDALRRQHGFHVAFQCCEHLNRALVVRRATLEQFALTEVTAVPVKDAGGSMAACAYRTWADAVTVEHVQAHAGIDVGDTLIGMHLRPVAVPVRPSVKRIGEAHVTAARTRPKLIGGARAVYTLEPDAEASAP